MQRGGRNIMDKYIKIDPEIWKKLKLAATLEDKTIKELATEYILKGLKYKFIGNIRVLSDLYKCEVKKKTKEKGKGK